MTSKPRARTGRERLAILAALAAIASLVAHTLFFLRDAHRGCTVRTPPDCVVALNNHGAISYISGRASLTLDGLMAAFIVFAAVAVVLTFMRYGWRGAPPAGPRPPRDGE